MPNETLTPGSWFPAGGWADSPVPSYLPGVETWPGIDGRTRWFVEVGSEAWEYYQGRRTKPAVVGLGEVRGRESFNLLPGPWQGRTSITITPGALADAPTGEGDPVSLGPIGTPESGEWGYANDPQNGPVKVGEPMTPTLWRTVFQYPGTLLAKLYPSGRMSEGSALWVGFLFPFLVWAALVWVAWKLWKASYDE